MNVEKLTPILQQVREGMEEVARKKSDGTHKNLGGWCILTSWVLFHVLRRRGLHPYVCKNHYHAFILCDDYIIDLTATQFNTSWLGNNQIYPPIYVSKDPGNHQVHGILDKTDKAKEIWGNLCSGWHQPVPLHDPDVMKLIKTV